MFRNLTLLTVNILLSYLQLLCNKQIKLTFNWTWAINCNCKANQQWEEHKLVPIATSRTIQKTCLSFQTYILFSKSDCKSNFIDKAKQNIRVFLLTIQTLIASAYPKVFIDIFGQALLKYFLYNVGKKIKACLSTKPFISSRMSAETWVSTGIYLFGLRHVHKNRHISL